MYVGPMGLPQDKEAGSTANPGWVGGRVKAYVGERGTSATRCVFGHFAYYGIHRLLPGPVEPRYVIFLRNPVQRLNSLYYYLRNNSPNYWHHEIIRSGWSIDEWLESTPALWVRNGQVRQLLIGTYPEVEHEPALHRDHLEEAKRRLRTFWFVGLTELFSQNSAKLYRRLGFTQLHGEAIVNATRDKQAAAPETIRRILAKNELDLELYQYGRQLHQARAIRGRVGGWRRKVMTRLRRLGHWGARP